MTPLHGTHFVWEFSEEKTEWPKPQLTVSWRVNVESGRRGPSPSHSSSLHLQQLVLQSLIAIQSVSDLLLSVFLESSRVGLRQ